MCFGENFDIFCLFEPLSHGNWNEEDTDARRDKKKSERFDVWAWREYHVRVLKGKLF